ncbi:PAS/PAC sensor hybrid histidine kinase [Mucilaginibacter gracilis]|uniref:histidine kinase n=1 Tax=Mucilaginibacter gracilis TaxID=423350 RepID=A0A495J9L8_9SPHI|nr:PAS domain S-box protein [Mucilaginibacter gracilis]RKR85607.1 PAS/PAC sensor hybrid histidine kinase [Mucilaginibacter gracilis]
MVLDGITVAENEAGRIAALESYHVLDTLPERDYDAITRLASYICEVPIALISLIDVERQWFKSKVGLEVSETPRADAFCRYTILGDEILEIPDALENELFVNNALVTGEPNVRFYAGAPLIDSKGFRLGSLCVIDSVPRKLTFEQRDALTTLAREVMSHLELRKQKKELEENLKLHNEFFNLFNNSPEIHCVMDRDSNIELINDSVTRILGFTPEQSIGKPIWIFFHPEDRESVLHVVEEGLRNNKKAYEVETRIITKNGEVRWISWSVISKQQSWYASGRDITYQKQMLAELQQLSLVASKVSNGVVISNANNNVVWINDAFETITGYQLKDVQNKHLGDVLQGELTDLAIIQKARELSEAKQSFEVDLLIYRKDGQPLWISVINSIILDSNGDVDKYIEVIIDITSKKKAELELIATKEEALQLNRAKDMFISVMSHEIRTPLNAVIGISDLLMDDNPAPSQKENLSILKFSADNLMTLINDVLDFTKVETGNIELEKINVDMRDLVNSVINSMNFKAQAKGIYLHAQIDESIPQYILGDKTRICQILLNLVGNSLKFTDKGGIVIDLKVIEQNKNQVRIRFEVSDTGIGIHPEKISSIFESFKQAEANITRLYGGTGLGLAITKRLVELHDSRINVESVYGQSSKFWFTITFNKGKNTLDTNTSEIRIGLKLNVLVVDDNHINRLLIDKVLKKWGATSDFAENGLQALDKIETNHNYDVVLMDIHMPEMGGLEATRILRAKDNAYAQQLPVIALTASMLTNQMDLIDEAGMNDYVLKPFDQKTLYDKISRYSKD